MAARPSSAPPERGEAHSRDGDAPEEPGTGEREEGGGSGDGENRRERSLSRDERRLLALLGLPTFALALALTTVSTYLPVVARDALGSSVVIGVIIALEGVMALWVPLTVGAWSDRLRSRWGRRLPFVVAATPAAVVTLVLMGALGSAIAIGFVVATFFIAYFVAYEPYRALYPDALPREISGRGQSSQAVWRGAGTGVSLLCGGLLVSVAGVAPFAAAAAILAVTIAAFAWALLRRGLPESERDRPPEPVSVSDQVRDLWELLREHAALRAFLVANALWELSLGALKTFVILYLTRGLGFSRVTSAFIVGGTAVIILIAAFASGPLGDRRGRGWVMRRALWLYGVGLLVPFFVTTPWILGPVLPLVAIGGGAVMSLPYAILIPLMPEDRHGALTGFYTLSRGFGIALGPLLAGVAITVLKGPFSGTEGYQAFWGVSAAAIFLSLVFLRRLGDARRDRRRLAQS